MKAFKFVSTLSLILFIYALSGTTLSSCTKTGKTDTLRIHDTTTVIDTVSNLSYGLVGYYNFNNGSLQDSSGFNNDIVFNNATTTTDRNGKNNNAYLFDGSSSYMSIANSPSLNSSVITLYAIIKVNGFYHGSAHGNFILMKSWDQANGMYNLKFSDYNRNSDALGLPDSLHETWSGAYGNNNNTVNAAEVKDTTGNYVAKGVWYKLAYTYDGLVGRLYVNGRLIGSVAGTVPFTANTDNIYIGRNNDPNGGIFPFWFNGVIDEVRIYNRALSPKAITQLVNLTN